MPARSVAGVGGALLAGKLLSVNQFWPGAHSLESSSALVPLTTMHGPEESTRECRVTICWRQLESGCDLVPLPVCCG